MAEPEIILWSGFSGKKYEYRIYPIGTEFKAIPANYVFAKEVTKGVFDSIYIGETGDLSERFDDHHKMRCILRHGATHITTHKSSEDKEERQVEEDDLIKEQNTPCNG